MAAKVEAEAAPQLSKMLTTFRAARKKGVPIIAIQTSDPMETIAAIGEMYADVPLMEWDIVKGISGLNEIGSREFLKLIPADPDTGQRMDPVSLTSNPTDALRIADRFPKSSMFFMKNADNYLESEAVQQAIWNERDTNKSFPGGPRTLVLLGVVFKLPANLTQDVLVLDEPMPNQQQITQIIVRNIDDYNRDQKKLGRATIEMPAPEILERTSSAALGLSAFAAEQATAMNITEKGINIGGVWDWKIAQAGQIRGLSVHRGPERYSDYVGNEYAKELQLAFINGLKRHKGIVLWDEVDKALAGTAGDNTGVSQELHGLLLQLIEDLKLTCLLYHGVWGSGKTHLVKSGRNEAKGGEIIMLKADLAQVKGGIVGSSVTNFMTLWKAMMAMCGDSPLMIFTCNSMKTLSSEFLSRMKVKLMFELPSEEELAQLWAVNMRLYGLGKQALPECREWTGRDVRNCCELSWELGVPLTSASQAIVPQAVGSREKLKAMRMEAHGVLIDARKPGRYQMPEAIEPIVGGGRVGRSFENN